MALYKTRQGWRYEFQAGGRRYTASGFPTKKDALAAREEHKNQVRGIRAKPKSWALSYLVVEYLDSTLERLATKTWKYKRFVYQSFLNHLGDLPLDQITPLLIDSYLRTRPSAYNANFHRKDLSAMFAWGVKHRLLAHNPVLLVDRFPEIKSYRRIPTQEEMSKILLAAGEHRSLLLVLFFTMARVGEILRLRWRDINFAQGKITLWTKKRRSGELEPDTLPMHQDLHQLLKGLWEKRTQDEWVFINPKTGTQFKHRPKIMRSICRRAGVPHYGFHAVRHFVATYLADREKLSAKAMQRLLRHQAVRTTEIYLHMVDSGLRDAINLLPSSDSLLEGWEG